MTPTVEQARAARQRWDEICEDAARTLRRLKPLAEERGDQWLVEQLELMANEAMVIKNAVNGRRAAPSKVGPGFKEAPPQIDQPPYEEAGAAVSRLVRYYGDGLGLPDWDWRRGFPPTWRSGWTDRWKAYLPYIEKRP